MGESFERPRLNKVSWQAARKGAELEAYVMLQIVKLDRPVIFAREANDL